jgi:hypothetical protein
VYLLLQVNGKKGSTIKKGSKKLVQMGGEFHDMELAGL